MSSAPSPAAPADPLADPGRVAALRALGLLDASPHPALERLARIAARALRAPVAQVNLLTFDQQIPVAVSVLPVVEGADGWRVPVPIEQSMCSAVVRTGVPLAVPDARDDPRWRDHRAVMERGVVAYAAAPVSSAPLPSSTARERRVIGTVCVVDFEPRRWTRDDLDTLRDLAQVAEGEVARYAGDSRLRAVFDEAPAMFFTVGADGTVLEVNRFGAAALGYTVDALVGRPVTDVFVPGDRAAAAAHLAATLDASGAPRTWELRKQHRDGRVLWVRETARAVRTADGEAAALVLCEDVTATHEAAADRARLADEARTARDLLWRVLEQAPVAIAVLRGPQHVVALANPRYRRLIGGGEVIGRPFAEVSPEAVGQDFGRMLDEVYRSGQPFTERAMPVHLDRLGTGQRELGTFDVSAHPLIEADGTTGGVITVVADTTEEVRARQDAETARAEAERQRAEAVDANAAKSQFLANMSHELRTPLNAIQGHVQLIEMGVHGPVTGDQRVALERVARAQQHLLALINDVLNFAKLEAGRVTYDLHPTHLADVLRDVVPLVEAQATAKHHALHVVLPEDRGEGEVVVLADRDKLGQVLLNLLSNAVKFTLPGGRIEVALTGRGGQLSDPAVAYLTVRDTGIGIPRDRQEAVFDPFVQVQEGLTRPYEGTGLGLAISRDLTRGMGGDLRVRSEQGRGSVFTVTLQRA